MFLSHRCKTDDSCDRIRQLVHYAGFLNGTAVELCTEWILQIGAYWMPSQKCVGWKCLGKAVPYHSAILYTGRYSGDGIAAMQHHSSSTHFEYLGKVIPPRCNWAGVRSISTRVPSHRCAQRYPPGNTSHLGSITGRNGGIQLLPTLRFLRRITKYQKQSTFRPCVWWGNCLSNAGVGAAPRLTDQSERTSWWILKLISFG